MYTVLVYHLNANLGGVPKKIWKSWVEEGKVLFMKYGNLPRATPPSLLIRHVTHTIQPEVGPHPTTGRAPYSMVLVRKVIEERRAPSPPTPRICISTPQV